MPTCWQNLYKLIMDESNQPKNRLQLAEDFILNPEKVLFELLTEFQDGIAVLQDIFKDVNIAELQNLKGKDGVDGKTPVFGVDYMTDEDITAIQEYVLSLHNELATTVADREETLKMVKAIVGKIPIPKGKPGQDGKDGKDGSPDTGQQILSKIRKEKKGQGLKMTDIEGLPRKLNSIISSVDKVGEVAENLKKNTNLTLSVPRSTNDDGGGGGNPAWGDITGTLSDQTDLQSALDAKATGPSSATDNGIARFDGATGKLIQDSAWKIEDSGALRPNVSYGEGNVFQTLYSEIGTTNTNRYPFFAFNATLDSGYAFKPRYVDANPRSMGVLHSSAASGDLYYRTRMLFNDSSAVNLPDFETQFSIIASQGKAGFGTNTPTSRLHIVENNTETGTGAGFTIEQRGTGDALLQFLLPSLRRWQIGIDNSDDDKFKISSTLDLGNALFTITNNGFLGLGLNTPTSPAHIFSGNATGLTIERNSSLGSAIQLKNSANNLFIGMDSDENFGISPNVNVGSSPWFYINRSTGNIGIGETSPSERLTVNGNGWLSGNLRVDGSYIDSSNNAGTAGQVLSATATGTAWVDAPSGGAGGGTGGNGGGGLRFTGRFRLGGNTWYTQQRAYGAENGDYSLAAGSTATPTQDYTHLGRSIKGGTKVKGIRGYFRTPGGASSIDFVVRVTYPSTGDSYAGGNAVYVDIISATLSISGNGFHRLEDLLGTEYEMPKDGVITVYARATTSPGSQYTYGEVEVITDGGNLTNDKNYTVASTATLTPIGAYRHEYRTVTALAASMTIAAPSTAVSGTEDNNTIHFRLKDNGTARPLTWNSIYVGTDDITLPTTTTVGKWLYISFRFNKQNNKWVALAVTTGNN